MINTSSKIQVLTLFLYGLFSCTFLACDADENRDPKTENYLTKELTITIQHQNFIEDPLFAEIYGTEDLLYFRIDLYGAIEEYLQVLRLSEGDRFEIQQGEQALKLEENSLPSASGEQYYYEIVIKGEDLSKFERNGHFDLKIIREDSEQDATITIDPQAGFSVKTPLEAQEFNYQMDELKVSIDGEKADNVSYFLVTSVIDQMKSYTMFDAQQTSDFTYFYPKNTLLGDIQGDFIQKTLASDPVKINFTLTQITENTPITGFLSAKIISSTNLNRNILLKLETD